MGLKLACAIVDIHSASLIKFGNRRNTDLTEAYLALILFPWIFKIKADDGTRKYYRNQK